MSESGTSNKAAFYKVIEASYPRAHGLSEIDGGRFFDHMIELIVSDKFEEEVVDHARQEAAEYIVDTGFVENLDDALAIVNDFETLHLEGPEHG